MGNLSFKEFMNQQQPMTPAVGANQPQNQTQNSMDPTQWVQGKPGDIAKDLRTKLTAFATTNKTNPAANLVNRTLQTLNTNLAQIAKTSQQAQQQAERQAQQQAKV